MNKKYIIILGTIFIFLIIFIGLTKYFQQNKINLDFLANLKSADKCEDLLQDKEYVICCVQKGKFYDCTEREEFNSGEEVEIIVSSLKIPAIEAFPSFNYTCLGTDISRKGQDGKIVFWPEECFTFERGSLFTIKGIIPPIKSCMTCRRAPDDPYGVFTLLRINLYPDVYNKDKEILVIQGDEEESVVSEQFTVLNLKARISINNK